MVFQKGSGGHPNYDIKNYGSEGGKSRTPIGKFVSYMSRLRREIIPPEMIEIFDFFKGMTTKDINYLHELVNLYEVTKTIMLPSLANKLIKGESLTKTEIDGIRLLKDTLVESHKLKYGDHKVIERIVTADDLRKQIFSDKKIIDVEAVSEEKLNKNQEEKKEDEINVLS